jgi:glycosyltransferase involved in cell wall biosynthesis
MTEPRVSVIVPTRNRLDRLRRALEAYERQSARVPFEVVVVDDGSTDGTGDWLKAQEARTFSLVACRQEKAGPAPARNRAIAEARGEWLILAGDDIVPGERFVDGHAEAQAAAGGGFVLGQTRWDPALPITSVMRHVDGYGAQQFRYGYLRVGQRLGFRYFYGSNLSLPRAALRGLEGPFDPAFGGAAFEDADLGYRLMGTAARIEYRPALVALHAHRHTLASFAERQQEAGRAASVLVRKHAEIASLVGFRKVEEAVRKVEEAVRKAGPGPGLDVVRRAEEALLLAFSPFEAEVGRWLDRVYLGLFWYFYAKGVVETRFPDAPRPAVLAWLLGRYVAWPSRAALRSRAGRFPEPARKALASALSALGPRPFREGLRWWVDSRLREARYDWRRSPEDAD